MFAPKDWSTNPNLFYHYYWSDDRNSLTSVLQRCYGLQDVKPIWARIDYVAYIFEASPTGTTDRHYYIWNGERDDVLLIKGDWTQDTLRDEINAVHGYVGRLDVEEVDPVPRH